MVPGFLNLLRPVLWLTIRAGECSIRPWEQCTLCWLLWAAVSCSRLPGSSGLQRSSCPGFPYRLSVWMICPLSKVEYWCLTITVLLHIYLCRSVNICLMYLGVLKLDAYIFMILNPFDELTPSSLYNDLFFWSPVIAFHFRSILSDTTIVNPTLFWFPLAFKQSVWGSAPPEKLRFISN